MDKKAGKAAKARKPRTPKKPNRAKAQNPDFEQAVRESFSRQGLMRQMGAWLEEVVPGRAVVELPFNNRLSQQHGSFHGAVIGATGATAGAYAAMSLMPAASEVIAVEYKINFTAPAKGQLLRAEAEVVSHGSNLSVVRVEISCLDGEPVKPCAVMQATMKRIEAAQS